MTKREGLLAVLAGMTWTACASQFDPTGDLYAQKMLVTVPPVQMAPRVDGRIAPAEWDCASAVTGFFSFNTGCMVQGGPALFLAYDPVTMYLLCVVPREEGRELHAQATKRDGPVYKDDSVEIFLCPNRANVFQVVVNSLGTIADLRDDDWAWNSRAVAKAGKIAGDALPASWSMPDGRYWFVEVAISAEDLGVSRIVSGSEWSVNCAVNRPKPWAVLAPTMGGTHGRKSLFCRLRFLESSDPYAQITSLGNIRFGDVGVSGRLVNPGKSVARLRVGLDLRKKGSYLTKDAYRNIVGVIHSQAKPFSVKAGSAVAVSMRMAVSEVEIGQAAIGISRLGDTGKPTSYAFVRHGKVKIEPPLLVRLGNVPSRKYIVLSIDMRGLKRAEATQPARAAGGPGATPVGIGIDVLNDEGEIVSTMQSRGEAETVEAKVSYRGLPVGRYTCAVTACVNGKSLARTEVGFNHVAPLPWATSTIYDDYGKEDRVPKPWTAVQTRQKAVSVWGRTMRWDDGVLPSSITSQGVELLKEPMQLMADIAGKVAPVPLHRLAFTECGKSRACLTAEGHLSGLRVTADMWIEYDGFLWVELRMDDSSEGRPIDSLHIVTTVPSEQATLYQTFARPLTGWVGREPIKLRWLDRPSAHTVNFYHWLGNEDRGLGFTFASLEHWRPASRGNFCTIAPTQGGVTYRINLIETPAAVSGCRFVFGIQATPIKPLPPDYHSMMGATLQYASWKLWYQTPANIDMALVWPYPQSKIMKALNDPYGVSSKLMAHPVKYAHDRGVAIVSVASCPQKICALSKEFDDYRLEWQTQPDSILNWHDIPHYQNCGRSRTLRKWLFYGWGVENVKKFGLDGVYFDGWQTGQIACSNPHHGCGWVDEHGGRHLTVPVLEGREFNQRMILFLEDHVSSPFIPPKAAPERKGFPRYHYWIHSWQFVPSIMGFATAWLTGEFAGYPLKGTSTMKPDGTLGGCLGLGLLRSRCLSTNWGLPNMFLPLIWEHLRDHPTDKQTLMVLAWLLPHGVPISDPKYMNQKTMLEIVRLMLRFQTRKASFTPAWRPNAYFEIESPIAREVMVATWDHRPAEKVLVVVSNLEVQETHTVALRWRGFAGVEITNARTGDALPLKDGRLPVTLGPESFVLLEAMGR